MLLSESQTPDADALHNGVSRRSTKSPLGAGDGAGFGCGSDDSDTDDNGGEWLSPTASDRQDAMSVDGDADAKSGVIVETPPRPPV